MIFRNFIQIQMDLKQTSLANKQSKMSAGLYSSF